MLKSPKPWSMQRISNRAFQTTTGAMLFGCTVGLILFTDAPSGRLLTMTPLVQLGNLDQHSTCDFRVTLYNDSRTAREIVTIDTGCSCTELSVPERIIGPYKSLNLDGVFNVGSARGDVANEVAIVSRPLGMGGQEEVTRSVLRAFAKPTFQIEPEHLVMRRNASGLIRATRDGSPVPIARAVANSSNLHLTIRDSGDLQVFDAGMENASGNADLQIILHFNDAKEPVVPIKVTIE